MALTWIDVNTPEFTRKVTPALPRIEREPKPMPEINFTKGAIDSLPLPEPGKRVDYTDAKTPGLALRVSGSGVKSFCVLRRVNGKLERLTLGKYPAMTVDQARKAAAQVNATIAKGQSPKAEKKRHKLEETTLQQVFDDYLATRKDLKPRTVTDMRNAFKEAFPDWLGKPLQSINPDAVANRHKQHGERSKARANLAMRYLRVLFNFAAARYEDAEGNSLMVNNPVKVLSKLKAWYRVDRRQTVIQPHQLGDWFNAVLTLPSQSHQDYFALVLMTGIRKDEALKLAWCDVDLTAKTMTLPDTKNHKDHTLPLSDYLVELLTRRKANAVSGKVFADETGRVISNFRYAQAHVTKAGGVEFCIHDLRRTFATIAESLDIPTYALKRLLNHADGQDVTAGYIVANVERLREPMQKITDYVLKSAGIKPTADVIPMRQVKL